MNAHRAEAVLDTFKAAEKEVDPAGTVYFWSWLPQHGRISLYEK
jgi:hypothetical protein